MLGSLQFYVICFFPYLQEFELRKHARNEGRRYCDPVVLTYQAERMPEQIRLKVGGVTPQQIAVYEEFARNIPGFLATAPQTQQENTLFTKPPTQVRHCKKWINSTACGIATSVVLNVNGVQRIESIDINFHRIVLTFWKLDGHRSVLKIVIKIKMIKDSENRTSHA